MVTQTFREIAVGDIELSGDNKRRTDEKTETFVAMVANVKAAGIVQPVLVRPHPKKKGKFELRAGERRFRAGRAAGLEMIPAVIVEADDQTAALITLLENQHRLDLESIEEAEQIALTVDRLGGDVKTVAARIGKDEKWVRMRVNVVGHLAKCWRDIFGQIEKHPMFKTWSLTHLGLIARLPEHVQVDLHKEIKERYPPYYDKAWGCSTRDLETRIGASLHLLSKASWTLNDGTLIPKAAACTECPKRSGHQPMLWFEAVDQAKAGDQCLDGFCWRGKANAWLKRRVKDLKNEHGSLTLITKEYPDYNEGEELAKAFGSYMDKYAYKIVSKSTEGAVPAMYINGKAAGQLTYIKPTAAQSDSGTRGRTPGRFTPLKERQAMLDAKRWAQVLIDLKEKVEKADVTAITYKDPNTAVMILAAGFGNSPLQTDYRGTLGHPKISRQEIEKVSKSKDQAKALAFLWESFKPTLEHLLTYSGPITQTPKELKEEAQWIAELIGVDLAATFKDVCSRKGFTVPKSWSGLNADGTPKDQKTGDRKQKTEGGERKAAKAKKVKAIEDTESTETIEPKTDV